MLKTAKCYEIFWKSIFFFFTNLKSTCDDVISFAKLAKTSWCYFVWQAFYVYLLIFSIRAFFHRHWWFTGQQGKGGDHLLFHSTTSTCSRTLRHLFATLHVTWISHIFNRNACVYQTQWNLSLYRMTISLINWWCNVCLFTWWIISRFFCYSDFTWDTGGFELGHHPCITSKPTNQLCQLTNCAKLQVYDDVYLQVNFESHCCFK